MPEYSISQLGKFEECALQYKFIYVDKIKRDEEGIEAFLGQRFHDAMEWLYKERAFRGSNRLGEARDGMAAFVMPSGFRGSDEHRRQPGIWCAEGGCAQAGAGEGWDFDENYRTCWSVLI